MEIEKIKFVIIVYNSQIKYNNEFFEEVLNKALKDLLNEEIAAIYGNRKRFVPYESQLFNSCA